MASASKGLSSARRLSLSRRLVAVVLAAVGTGMIVSAAVSVWQQSLQFAEGRREVLLATAHAFSAAAALPASNADASGALAAIRAIGNVPDILYAEVRGRDGRTLATLGSAPRLIGDASLDGDQSVFDLLFSQTVQATVPIVHGGTPSGQLTLIGGTAGLWGRLIGTVATTAFGGLVALVVGLVVGWRFQRRITRPLRQLVSTMAQVREQHKYNVAIEEAGDREIGLLIDGFNAMLSDIRERDARLETHRRNLEKDVADRTRDLRDARDAAEAANRAKSDFLATMSHEIRTPMNGIMVMAELLAQGEMPPRQRRCADVIVSSGQSLLAIINDILDFSKIEAGKLELERVPFNVAQLADTTVSLFAERARSKNVDLAALVDPATPRVIESDPVRLTQIVGNLVNNALKFTERGYVNATIAPAAGRPGWLTITVADTGVGIPPDKLDVIFDAFSQADQSTTRHYGGTGLGLAICKRLVTALGGDIDVNSIPGQGSTFIVTLPVTTADTAAQSSHWPQLALELGRHATCVIDLEGEATVAAASRYFAASGYQVVRPDEQLAPAGYDSAAVVCITAEKLKAAPQRSHGGKPAVVAVADLGDVSAERLIDERVANAILTKPLLRGEVEELLARLVAGETLTARVSGTKHAGAPEFPGLRVLVADDSEVNREVAVAALSRLGAVTHTVENGAQAIAAVQNEAFDVVLMDGSMPDIDGFEAARQIRAIEMRDGRKRLPIVALTAHVIGTSAQAWSDAGMDAVVYKPYTLAQLALCFQKLFPQWPASGTSAAEHSLSAEDRWETASGAVASEQDDGMLDTSILHDLQQMVGSAGEAWLQRVFRLYVENARRCRDELVRAIGMGDQESCARAAHALKSMSQNIGAQRVAANADAIERYAREDSIPQGADLQSLDMVLDATIAIIAIRLEANNAARSSQPKRPSPIRSNDGAHLLRV
jgi:signal transduction histidine kinase/CheY-like chemotaxis protein